MPTAGQRRHEAFQRQVAEFYERAGWEVYSLATKERADLFMVSTLGRSMLAEVKSSRKGNHQLSSDERECMQKTQLPYLRIRPGTKRGTIRVKILNRDGKEVTFSISDSSTKRSA
jgi:hypothetical protein